MCVCVGVGVDVDVDVEVSVGVSGLRVGVDEGAGMCVGVLSDIASVRWLALFRERVNVFVFIWSCCVLCLFYVYYSEEVIEYCSNSIDI